MCSMHEADVAFILSPAAAGSPISPGPAKNSKAKPDARSVFVLSLGVPVIVANIAGDVDTALPENLRQLRIDFPQFLVDCRLSMGSSRPKEAAVRG